MKLTVKVNLNVRVGKPSVNAPCYKYVTPGTTLEVDENLYPGDRYDGNDTWYKDDAGNYYWSGGFDNINSQIQSEIENASDAIVPIYNFDPDKMSWAHDSVENGGLGIVDLWNKMGVRGEGVNVAVVDTGIIEHEDFKRDGISIIKESRYSNQISSIIDSEGHGTNSASIIAATGNKLLFGVAPEANLYIIKSSENQYVTQDHFLSGLKLIDSQFPLNIISISYCFDSTNKDFENYFSSINENCICVSALTHYEGDNILINNNQFPANYKNVIPVVALKKNLIDILSPCELLESQSKLNWGFPGEDILVLNEMGKYQNAQQTSIATPFGSGVIALFISYMMKCKITIDNSNITKLKNLITNTASKKRIDIVDNGQNKSATILNINPIEAFNQFAKYFK